MKNTGSVYNKRVSREEDKWSEKYFKVKFKRDFGNKFQGHQFVEEITDCFYKVKCKKCQIEWEYCQTLHGTTELYINDERWFLDCELFLTCNEVIIKGIIE